MLLVEKKKKKKKGYNETHGPNQTEGKCRVQNLISEAICIHLSEGADKQPVDRKKLRRPQNNQWLCELERK